ncbi:hypothetical protein TcWFU_007196 [Taenia crassiceps]|uniref:Uncharacterized protein n=1 Tax=Taenia crassiceps TaxID=6207 RepID=A0ABR4Q6P5_9CEST
MITHVSPSTNCDVANINTDFLLLLPPTCTTLLLIALVAGVSTSLMMKDTKMALQTTFLSPLQLTSTPHQSGLACPTTFQSITLFLPLLPHLQRTVAFTVCPLVAVWCCSEQE